MTSSPPLPPLGNNDLQTLLASSGQVVAFRIRSTPSLHVSSLSLFRRYEDAVRKASERRLPADRSLWGLFSIESLLHEPAWVVTFPCGKREQALSHWLSLQHDVKSQLGALALASESRTHRSSIVTDAVLLDSQDCADSDITTTDSFATAVSRLLHAVSTAATDEVAFYSTKFECRRPTILVTELPEYPLATVARMVNAAFGPDIFRVARIDDKRDDPRNTIDIRFEPHDSGGTSSPPGTVLITQQPLAYPARVGVLNVAMPFCLAMLRAAQDPLLLSLHDHPEFTQFRTAVLAALDFRWFQKHYRRKYAIPSSLVAALARHFHASVSHSLDPVIAHSPMPTLDNALFHSARTSLTISPISSTVCVVTHSTSSATPDHAIALPVLLSSPEAFQWLCANHFDNCSRIESHLTGLLAGILSELTDTNRLPLRLPTTSALHPSVFLRHVAAPRVVLDLSCDDSVCTFKASGTPRYFALPLQTPGEGARVRPPGGAPAGLTPSVSTFPSIVREGEGAFHACFSTQGQLLGPSTLLAQALRSIVQQLDRTFTAEYESDIGLQIWNLFAREGASLRPLQEIERIGRSVEVHSITPGDGPIPSAAVAPGKSWITIEPPRVTDILAELSHRLGLNVLPLHDPERRAVRIVVADPPDELAADFLLADLGFLDAHGDLWPSGEYAIQRLARTADVFIVRYGRVTHKRRSAFLRRFLNSAFEAVFDLAAGGEKVAICCRYPYARIAEDARRALEQERSSDPLQPRLSWLRQMPGVPRTPNKVVLAELPLVVLCGPSGAGKGLLRRLLQDVSPVFVKPDEHSTRAPRPDEATKSMPRSQAEVIALGSSANRLFPYEGPNAATYYTDAAHVDLLLSRGRIPVLDLDVASGFKALDRWPRSRLIYVDAVDPSAGTGRDAWTAADAILAKRIRSRDSSISSFELDNRMKRATSEREQLLNNIQVLDPGARSRVTILVNDSGAGSLQSRAVAELQAASVFPSQPLSSEVSSYGEHRVFDHYPRFTDEKDLLLRKILEACFPGRDLSLPEQLPWESEHVEEQLSRIADHMSVPPMTFLDIGSGAGAISIPLAAFFKDSHFVEPEDFMFRVLSEKVRRFRLRRPTKVVNVLKVRWPDEVPEEFSPDADLVTLIHVYHFRDRNMWHKALSRAKHAMRPGAKLVIVYLDKRSHYFTVTEAVKKVVQGARYQPAEFPHHGKVFAAARSIFGRAEEHVVDSTVRFDTTERSSAAMKWYFKVFYDEFKAQEAAILAAVPKKCKRIRAGETHFEIACRNRLLVCEA